MAAAQPPSDFDAVLGVLQGTLAHCLVRVAERSVLIFLILKKVGINRSRQDSIAFRKFLDVVRTSNPIGAVPQHMQRYRWAHTRELVDLTCIAEFFLGGRGCSRLNEFSEARASIGKDHTHESNAR